MISLVAMEHEVFLKKNNSIHFKKVSFTDWKWSIKPSKAFTFLCIILGTIFVHNVPFWCLFCYQKGTIYGQKVTFLIWFQNKKVCPIFWKGTDSEVLNVRIDFQFFTSSSRKDNDTSSPKIVTYFLWNDNLLA